MNFVLIGAAGFVAPRHMKAIKDVGGTLLAAIDPHDSVGILDSFFPECEFFTEFERFDRHCELLRRNGTRIDYVVVCSPNYLHDAHCRFGLRIGADVICEKPLCINTKNVDALIELDAENGWERSRISCILQLRLNRNAIEAKREFAGKTPVVFIEYNTPRGNWYHASWKGNVEKSGGLCTNIGVHLFDLMAWMFGECKNVEVLEESSDKVVGFLEMDGADVHFSLSTRMDVEPKRILTFNNTSIDLSGGFTELHTESYRQILAGNGFRPSDAREAIRITEMIRDQGRSTGQKRKAA